MPQAPIVDRPLKICLLGYRSQPFSGGQGIYLRYLSRALRDLGHEVTVISGEPYPMLDDGVTLIKMPGLNLFAEENSLYAFKKRYLREPINFFEWWDHNSGGFPEPLTFSLRLARWFRTEKPDFDVVHDNQCLGRGLLDIKRQGYPVLATIHHPITVDRDIAIAAAPSRMLRLLAKRWHMFLSMQIAVARKLPAILTVSESSKRDIARDFKVKPERMHVVFNGIDTEMFAPRPGIARRANRIMATSSADHPLKGLNFLIEALAQLRETRPDLELLVIGAPKPGGQTEALIKKLNLEDAISFRHGLTAEEIVDLYAEATLAVSPSVYEGFGLPAAEAMACGVPLVSSDGGALPEVVGDAGIVVPKQDAGALAGAIGQLLDDEGLRAQYGIKGRERILQEFTWEQAARETLGLYQEVMGHADRSI